MLNNLERIKSKKLLKFILVVSVYSLIFFFLIFNLPDYIYTEDSEPWQENNVEELEDDPGTAEGDINIEETIEELGEKEPGEDEEPGEEKPEENAESEQENNVEPDKSTEGPGEDLEELAEDAEEPDEDIESPENTGPDENIEEPGEDNEPIPEENKKPNPIIDYTFSETDEFTVNFDASESFDIDGTIESYSWDFGDGTSASEVTATHTYELSGIYRVILTVTDDDVLQNSCEKNVNVISKKPNPIIDYTFSETDEFTVNFDASKSFDIDGTIESYSWDFGDDTSAIGVTVTHKYDSPGIYRVILTVKDGRGLQNSCEKNVNIKDEEPGGEEHSENRNPQPIIIFSFPDIDTVHFDGSHSFDNDGEIIYYNWDFGDGTTASGVTATHTYELSGIYRVILTVTDDDGLQNSCERNVKVISKKPHPIFDFTFSETDEFTVNFDASKSFDIDGTVVSYNWEFGDGLTGKGPLITHTYNSQGIYRVTLTVTDDSELQNSCEKNVNIKLEEEPGSDVEPEDDEEAREDEEEPAEEPEEDIETQEENIEPEQIIEEPVKEIGEIIEEPIEEPEEDKKPHAKMTYNFLDIDTVIFDGSGSFDNDGEIIYYYWDFGDGTTASSVTVTHTYTAPGHYRVTLTVIDNEGFANRISRTINLQLNNISETSLSSTEEDYIESSDNKDTVEPEDKYTGPVEKLKNFMSGINNTFKKLFNVERDKTLEEIPDLNINSMKELSNIQKMLEKGHEITTIIDLDEIVDVNYEKDITEHKEAALSDKLPEPLSNFWNKFKEIGTLYN